MAGEYRVLYENTDLLPCNWHFVLLNQIKSDKNDVKIL